MTSTTTRDAARALRESILGEDYERPSPFVVVPAEQVPKGAKGQRLRETGDAFTLNTQRLDNTDALADRAEADLSDSDAWAERSRAVADRIATGDTASAHDALPTHDPAQYLAAFEVHLLAVKSARRTLAQAVKAYDAAVLDALDDLLPGLVKQVHREAEAASAAVEVARVAVAAPLSSRALALRLRAARTFAELTAAGSVPREHLIPSGRPGISLPGGWLTVKDQAERKTAAAFAFAPPVSETAANLSAVSDALASMAREDASAEWPTAPVPTPAPVRSQAEQEALARMAAASGAYADGTKTTWSHPSTWAEVR